MATASVPEVRGGEDVSVERGLIGRFWHSTIGKKIVMAVTGFAGIAFLVVHMVGNLQMFKPDDAAQAMHDYAVGLRALGPALWAARIGLLVAVILHVIAAYQLTMRARAARPLDYVARRPQVSTLASRTMRVGGVILLAFIVFHIADMTFGVGHPQFVHLDPYNNLRVGFMRWWALAFYLVAIAFLGLHLYHGLWSSWRTVGGRRPSERPRHRNIAIVLTVLLILGFAAVPIAAALGAFEEDYPILEMRSVQSEGSGGPALVGGGR